jgi:hypothetical protein
MRAYDGAPGDVVVDIGTPDGGTGSGAYVTLTRAEIVAWASRILHEYGEDGRR